MHQSQITCKQDYFYKTINSGSYTHDVLFLTAYDKLGILYYRNNHTGSVNKDAGLSTLLFI